ncbi:hypothetical protein FHS57_001408 [Runella defluvii]|uniref:Lipocalin-like domain-containing protein n=1 Tax=Runella defluvii TaxID=370973 RepID=A0A7W5ZIC2_9BACT|nr:hypothetical protein [Runella defluvii]MBB3837414.1 hypothetical protein [Runella defluvii]
MKPVIFLLLIVVLGSCKPKTVVPETIAPLVGKWRLEAYESTVNGKKEWTLTSINASTANYILIREDGVLLTGNGQELCCAPAALIVNGKRFEIVPKSAIPNNPMCALVDCIGCATWDIEWSEDTFILNLCVSSSRSRYVRED